MGASAANALYCPLPAVEQEGGKTWSGFAGLLSIRPVIGIQQPLHGHTLTSCPMLLTVPFLCFIITIASSECLASLVTLFKSWDDVGLKKKR